MAGRFFSVIPAPAWEMLGGTLPMNAVVRLITSVWFEPLAAAAGGFQLIPPDSTGMLAWSNAPSPGICIVEQAGELSGSWSARPSQFATNATGALAVGSAANRAFFRAQGLVVAGGDAGFSNLVSAYGVLNTIAGLGWYDADGLNNWLPQYEGGPATNANLSRPHIAMADRWGNIFIADKNSHSILKVTPDGLIHTAAGTHTQGDTGDGPALATTLALNQPNGEWVRTDGTLYILDTGNGKVRRLGTNAMMQTLFSVPGGISIGRGLWMKDDESLAYFCNGTEVDQWTPSGGVKKFCDGFTELGNLTVPADGLVLVTDRGANAVYSVTKKQSVRIAGDGSTNATVEGAPVLATGLPGVRGIWPLPIGGYLLATHEGSQVLYWGPDNLVHIFVQGAPGDYHSGDGDYFRTPGYKISEVRSVTLDYDGNVLMVENDYGFVRKITFQRMAQ